jgi:alkanesulfonate monooxygenase SsuD/methylene tetrahydromethanopterin reductase-like flavin-dependent oxidoreductase (luciferase family)
MGGDFAHRWSQTREALDVMKRLWTQEEAEHHGKYFDFPLVRSYPKPVQKPYPPILIGGAAKNVLQRVVDHADGWLPNRVTPAELEDSRRQIEKLAAAAGRNPKTITITVYGQEPDRAAFKSLLDAGADRVVVRPEYVETEAEMGAQLERIAEAVL